MMTGVTVLAQNPIMQNVHGVGLIWGLGIFVVVLFISIICSLAEHDSTCMLISLIGLALAFLVGGGVEDATKIEVATGKYTYDVTIDDSVSFKEFSNRYDVINQNGEIYTIREKEKGTDEDNHEAARTGENG